MPVDVKMTQSLCSCFLLAVLCGIELSLAMKYVTVRKGETLTLNCRVRKGKNDVEWRNPDNHLMFFRRQKSDKYTLRDPRYSLHESSSTYSVTISNVYFRDGGIYSCLHYHKHKIISREKFKVIVLGAPKIEFVEHEGKTMIKCSAEANAHPPKLSWLFENGIELEARHQRSQYKKTDKYSSTDIIHIQSHKRRTTVKCLLRHPALFNEHLIAFVTIENTSIPEQVITEGYRVSTTDETTWQPTVSTTRPPRLTTEGIGVTKQAASETTYTEIYINTSFHAENTSENITNGFDSPEERKASRNAPLFVSAVTFLIVCLLIVVTFLLVKLRKAHQKWKLENEESEQSVESGKSKSSGEEKNPRRGLGFRNNFSKYKAEERPTAKSSTSTSTTTIEVIGENQSIHQAENLTTVTTTAARQAPTSQVKETDL
ncbi:cytotoxic and regulatory T-cell molecule-like isoform X1 [Denticeps clupeoides]|uniref:cytotoxic and regulatory T-cell molecule-like isoform X1 n=1 Tax=Denticeps clupeoides TaxID=299321 RepID=UPI0010A546BF|nr:cytotoxic and regulatory T-cell molecule-like isoform X1 [Denticeps clupeoides]